MIFTWIVFVSTGILIARHFKPLLPNKKICGKAIWFVIHRTIMTTAVILTITAFILILVYKQGKWVSQDTPREFAHSIIGVIIICFAIIQPIMALFRCKPDAEYRFIFNYAHRTVGLIAFILSIVAIFLALFFTQFTFEMNNQWGILVAWTCWIPVIFFIFWFIEFYFQKNRSNNENGDSYDLGNTEEKNGEKQVINNVKQDRIKLGFLMIHILVALGLALTLAIFVGQQ
jgi:Ca2+/Na+ antiporter